MFCASEGGDVKCWQSCMGSAVELPACTVRAGLTLAVETGGSLFCSAALKSCNDRFSAVFFWTRGPVIRAPFPTRSIPIDPPQRGARARGCQCVRGWRVRSRRGSITRERALWQTDGKKLFICGGTKEVRQEKRGSHPVWNKSAINIYEYKYKYIYMNKLSQLLTIAGIKKGWMRTEEEKKGGIIRLQSGGCICKWLMALQQV